MTRSRLRTAARWALLGLAALCVTGTGAWADDTSRLGAGGQIFRLHSGAYGDLFPQGNELPPSFEVLALDVVDPEFGSQRWMVPGTENRFAEVSGSTVYEAGSQTLYVLWEGFHNGIHPRIYLTSFQDDAWGELLRIGASPFGRKSSPRLSIVQESYQAEDSSLSWTDRTFLQLTWWEGLPSGSSKKFSPVLIEDGEFVGPAAIADLSDLVGGDLEAEYPSVAPGIENALRIVPGHNHRSVIVAFLDPGSGDLVALDVETLPAALVDLAEKARLQIINLGHKNSHEELAAAAAEAILALETDFHQVTLAWFAEQVRQMIEQAEDDLSDEGVATMAGKARLQIINLGATFKDHGLQEVTVLHLLEVPGADQEAIGHFLKVAETFRRAAPETGDDAVLFLSETGQRVIVAWQDGDRIYYTASLEEGWSEASFLTLGPSLDRDAAFELLENRVRSR